MRADARHLVLAALGLLLTACVSLLPPANVPITRVKPADGYYPPIELSDGGHQVLLAFSGGGTRAAALSYGVLQELRDTYVADSGKPVRLLNHVRYIASVSGGSFTAAYYGLYGDDTFKTYEGDFLHANIQGALIRGFFNPANWLKSIFSGFDRTEMAVDYYNNTVFRGATFNSLRAANGPFIEIQSTDIAYGNSFGFTQSNFDVICSDLGAFSVARAVTASSAVPVLFPSITLKNNGGHCDNAAAPAVDRQGIQKAKGAHDEGDDVNEIPANMRSYLDVQKNAYLHLVDGGVADNLGVGSILQRMNVDSVLGVAAQKNPPKSILLILVNATVEPESTVSHSPFDPGVRETASILLRNLITRQTLQTRQRLYARVHEVNAELKKRGKNMPVYLAEVSFEGFDSLATRRYFNRLPTTLELPSAVVNNLIAAGRTLLRTSPQYQQFVRDQDAMLVTSAVEKIVPMRGGAK